MSYAEKLRDPRWQKKRLAVLERAGWKCESCGNDKAELQVHHLAYHEEPWSVTDDQLECLCWLCHEKRESINAQFKELILSFATKDLMRVGFELHMLLQEGTINRTELAKALGDAIESQRNEPE